jgi:hypothetical protein
MPSVATLTIGLWTPRETGAQHRKLLRFMEYRTVLPVNEFVVNECLANEFEVDELAVNLGGERNHHSPPAVPSVLVNPQLPLPFHGEARPTRAEAGVASAAVGTVGKC